MLSSQSFVICKMFVMRKKWKLERAKRKRRLSFHKEWLNSLNKYCENSSNDWSKREYRITGSTSVLSFSLLQEQPALSLRTRAAEWKDFSVNQRWASYVPRRGRLSLQEKICFRAKGHGLLGHDRTISSSAWTFDPRHRDSAVLSRFLSLQTVKHRSVKGKKEKEKNES